MSRLAPLMLKVSLNLQKAIPSRRRGGIKFSSCRQAKSRRQCGLGGVTSVSAVDRASVCRRLRGKIQARWCRHIRCSRATRCRLREQEFSERRAERREHFLRRVERNAAHQQKLIRHAALLRLRPRARAYTARRTGKRDQQACAPQLSDHHRPPAKKALNSSAVPCGSSSGKKCPPSSAPPRTSSAQARHSASPSRPTEGRCRYPSSLIPPQC